MDTPSQVFADYLAINGHGYDGRRTTTLDQSFPMFADRVFNRDATFPASRKMDHSGLRGWEATEDTIEIADPSLLRQPMFVRPGLYTEEDGDTTMTLRSRTSKTPSKTPELTRSRAGRLTSSLKSSSSLKSEFSGSSSKSLSASTDITAPDLEPPKKRTRTRKIKKEVSDEDNKRGKFLERNRIAASKCREKKKQFVSELEETKITLEHQHAQLQVEYNALVGEVGSLKHELMLHAKCNDPNIDKWISNEARKFVLTSDLFGHQRAAAAGQGASSDRFAHTRHSSASSVHNGMGLGDFSDASGNAARRGSLAYSQGTSLDYGPEDLVIDPAWTASSTQTSPTDMAFPALSSPQFCRDSGMNFDHMPDDLFEPEH